MTVEEQVIKVTADHLGIKESDISPRSNFEKDLGADSLDIVEVQMALEDEFGFQLSDEIWDSMKTVQGAIDNVLANLNGG